MITTEDVAYICTLIERAPSNYPRRAQLLDDLQDICRHADKNRQPWNAVVDTNAIPSALHQPTLITVHPSARKALLDARIVAGELKENTLDDIMWLLATVTRALIGAVPADEKAVQAVHRALLRYDEQNPSVRNKYRDAAWLERFR